MSGLGAALGALGKRPRGSHNPYGYDPALPVANGDPRLNPDGIGVAWHPSQPVANEWEDWGSAARPIYDFSSAKHLKAALGTDVTSAHTSAVHIDPSVNAVSALTASVGFTTAVDPTHPDFFKSLGLGHVFSSNSSPSSDTRLAGLRSSPSSNDLQSLTHNTNTPAPVSHAPVPLSHRLIPGSQPPPIPHLPPPPPAPMYVDGAPTPVSAPLVLPQGLSLSRPTRTRATTGVVPRTVTTSPPGRGRASRGAHREEKTDSPPTLASPAATTKYAASKKAHRERKQAYAASLADEVPALEARLRRLQDFEWGTAKPAATVIPPPVDPANPVQVKVASDRMMNAHRDELDAAFCKASTGICAVRFHALESHMLLLMAGLHFCPIEAAKEPDTLKGLIAEARREVGLDEAQIKMITSKQCSCSGLKSVKVLTEQRRELLASIDATKADEGAALDSVSKLLTRRALTKLSELLAMRPDLCPDM